MVIIISYNKQTWNEYNDGQTADENLANGAIISADRLNHMENGISNNDINKVTDNHDGTEQLNGVKIQPFNKLSDTIGGQNLLINTAQLNDSTVCVATKSNISETYLGLKIYQTNSPWDGVRIYWPYVASKIKTDTNYVMSEYVRNTSPTASASIGIYGDDTGVRFNSRINYSFVTLPPNSGWTRISSPVNIASFPAKISDNRGLRFDSATALTDGCVQFAGIKLEKGSIATDWTPAPEDKVNVSDMRKPASDVAGIDEVNAKQDKIGYTPADDSKVAHLSGANNFDTVPTYGTNNKPFAINDTGATTARPTGQAVGYQYFDTTLNKPIWYNGANWVDSTGTTV